MRIAGISAQTSSDVARIFLFASRKHEKKDKTPVKVFHGNKSRQPSSPVNFATTSQVLQTKTDQTGKLKRLTKDMSKTNQGSSFFNQFDSIASIDASEIKNLSA